jgi:hypothetical protein
VRPFGLELIVVVVVVVVVVVAVMVIVMVPARGGEIGYINVKASTDLEPPIGQSFHKLRVFHRHKA